MEPEEIADIDSLESWMKERPREDAIHICHRAALRLVPVWCGAVSEDSLRTIAQSGLFVVRSLLTVWVGKERLPPKVRNSLINCTNTSVYLPGASIARVSDVAEAAREVARSVLAFDSFKHAAGAVSYAARAASNTQAKGIAVANAAWPTATFATRDTISRSLVVSKSSARLAHATVWLQAREDAITRIAADVKRDEKDFEAPLHLRPQQAEWHAPFIERMRTVWAPATPGGEFWMRWYQGFLDGNPLPWDLQHDIALIPDEDWQKGEAHIARLIEIIEERHRLLGLVAELKERLREATTVAVTDVASPEHRGHNQPPELLDAPAQLRETVTVIRIALDEAEKELAKSDPAPSTLRRIAATLTDAVKAAFVYCGSKLDVFVTKAVEEGGTAFGKWGIAAVIAYLAAPTGTMSTLINGLVELASKLSP